VTVRLVRRVLCQRHSSYSTSSWSSGFYPLPTCRDYQASRPRVISTTRESVTLCTQLRFRDRLRGSVYEIPGNSRSQHRRASLGKTHCLPVCRPTSQWFGSPDIRSCSATPARPPPHCHIVGSLFTTYTGSASCFLRTLHFWKLPLPCWRCPSVR